MTDLAAFLLARYDEDEAAAQGALFLGGETWWKYYEGSAPTFDISVDPRRVLAEVEAKRQIVRECSAVIRNHFSDDYTADDLAETTLRLLALPYAAHPDYRAEEWQL